MADGDDIVADLVLMPRAAGHRPARQDVAWTAAVASAWTGRTLTVAALPRPAAYPGGSGSVAMTSVSVLVPCYNYGHFLEDAVTSVLDDQEGVDVRALILDDASPDDSADMARKIAARDPRVEVTVHTANIGNIATYNEGLLDWADGDYCVLVSADDRLTPGALRRARDLLDTHPGVGFVYGLSLWFRHDAPLPSARTRVRGWSVWPGQWWLERRFRQAENPITSPEVVVRTSLQKRVGGYDARLPHLETWSCGCGWRQTPMLASYAELTRPTTACTGKYEKGL